MAISPYWQLISFSSFIQIQLITVLYLLHPLVTAIDLITPSRGERKLFSIFIASRINKGSFS
jgi:hypothetical protein